MKHITQNNRKHTLLLATNVSCPKISAATTISLRGTAVHSENACITSEFASLGTSGLMVWKAWCAPLERIWPPPLPLIRVTRSLYTHNYQGAWRTVPLHQHYKELERAHLTSAFDYLSACVSPTNFFFASVQTLPTPKCSSSIAFAFFAASVTACHHSSVKDACLVYMSVPLTSCVMCCCSTVKQVQGDEDSLQSVASNPRGRCLEQWWAQKKRVFIPASILWL